MDMKKTTASSVASTLAEFEFKDDYEMNITTLDRELKLAIVFAACDGIISRQTAYELIQNLGYREI
jgi:hypothetical protein